MAFFAGYMEYLTILIGYTRSPGHQGITATIKTVATGAEAPEPTETEAETQQKNQVARRAEGLNTVKRIKCLSENF
jgi:hypothetical protein